MARPDKATKGRHPGGLLILTEVAAFPSKLRLVT